MAFKVLKTSATLSTSAGSWEVCGAANLSYATINANSNWLSANSPSRNIAFTSSVTGNAQGLTLLGRNLSVGTLTIKLQENVASVWTDRTTNAFTLNAAFAGGGTNTINNYHFPTTAYAIDTTASKWRYNVSCSSASPTFLTTSAAAGTDLCYAVEVSGDTTKPAANDFWILSQGTTLTVDEAFTVGTGTGTNSGITMCYNTTINVPLPPAPLTLTFNRNIYGCNHNFIYIGSETTPITAAGKITIDCTNAGATKGFYCNASGTVDYTYGGLGTVQVNRLEIWGVEVSKIATRVAAQANSGTATITTTADMSDTWVATDTLVFVGSQNATDSTSRVISSITGTSIVLTSNLSYNLSEGGAVINTSRSSAFGVQFIGRGADTPLILSTGLTTKVQGLYCTNGAYVRTFGSSSLASLGSSHVIKDVLQITGNFSAIPRCLVFGNNSTVENYFVNCVYVGNQSNITYTYIFGTNCSVTNYYDKHITGAVYTVTDGVFINSTVQGFVFGPRPGITVSGVVIAHCRAGYVMGTFNSPNANISDVFLYSGTTGVALLLNVVGNNISNLTCNSSGTTNIHSINSVNTEIANSKFSNIAVASTSDFYLEGASLQGIVFRDCTFGGASIVTDITATLSGSYFRYHNYQGTTNDHRGNEPYGNYASTGDGLTDTTVHTSGTGAFAIRFEPTSSTISHTWIFNIPTGNIQNKTMMVGVWCKINSATYYAGTHQMPRITIDYDNGTTAYTQAAQTTDWQFLPLPFTPTTTYGQIIVTLSARTDATSTNAYVYFDDFKTLYPAETPLNTQPLDLWADALPVTPPIATVLSANDVWSAASNISYGTDTMGNKLRKQPLVLSSGDYIIKT